MLGAVVGTEQHQHTDMFGSAFVFNTRKAAELVTAMRPTILSLQCKPAVLCLFDSEMTTDMQFTLQQEHSTCCTTYGRPIDLVSAIYGVPAYPVQASNGIRPAHVVESLHAAWRCYGYRTTPAYQRVWQCICGSAHGRLLCWQKPCNKRECNLHN
jgi:hypothetical protein